MLKKQFFNYKIKIEIKTTTTIILMKEFKNSPMFERGITTKIIQ